MSEHKDYRRRRIRQTVQLSPYLHQELRRIATQNDKSISVTIRALLLRGIEQIIEHEESKQG